MTAPRRRLIVKELREQFHVSQRRASRALDLARSSLRYAPVLRDEQAALARRIEELAGAHPRYGYRRIWALLDREGWSVNKVSVHAPGIDPSRTEEVREPSRLLGILCWRGFAPINWCWGPVWERVQIGRAHV